MPLLRSVGGNMGVTNMNIMTSLSLGNLTTVSGSLSFQSVRTLSATAISNGLRQLVSVNGLLSFWAVSQRGSTASSNLLLPELQWCGALTVRELNSPIVTFPRLTTINGTSGQMNFFSLGNARLLDFPSLRSVSVQIYINNLPALGNLCHLGLPQSGYTSTSDVSST